MLGSSKPVVFDPYGRRRSRWRPPRWLVLLLGGIAVGVGGVLFVQERYLPPRLSADDSARLRAAYEQANAERQKLKSDLASTGQRLDAALADTARLGTELAGSRDTVERLRGDLAFAVESLPPDPRGGRVEVRAGRFAVKGGALNYDIVLSRDGGGGKPMSGVLQLIVSGDSARGVDTAVSLKPLPISLGAHSTLRGDLPLPEGFRPKQATIQVLDRPAGQPLGMRVMLVK